MKNESKNGVKRVVQEFVSGKITGRKLSMDGENYLQSWKIVKIHVKGQGKKRHLTEGPLEPMTDKWEQDDAHFFSQILNSLKVKTQDMVMHTSTVKEI